MHKIVLTTIMLFVSIVTMAQLKAQKPKVMIVPEEAFCINSGLYKVNSAGNKVVDYIAAMRNDNVLNVINTFEK